MSCIPKVNVLMSTYNGEMYVRPQIISILNQKGVNSHLTIRDDGSVDDTVQIINYFSNMNDSITATVSHNLGVVSSFFQMLKESSSEFDYYAFADQDDVWCEDKLSAAIAKLKLCSNNETPTMYCSRVEYTDEYLKHLGYSKIPVNICFDSALVENIAFGCTIVLNKLARDLLCSFPVPTCALMHDWWIYLAMIAMGKVVYDETPRIKYRQHSKNVVGFSNNYILRNVRKIYPFIVFINSSKPRTTDQAKDFYNIFRSRLHSQDISIINRFVNAKDSLTGRFLLIISNKYCRQNSLDNFLFKLQILLGKY